jgi:hypothetical protein
MTVPGVGEVTSRGHYVVDFLERVLATAAEGGIAYVITAIADWPVWATVPLVTGATAVKAWLAKFIGSADSASLSPRV